VGSCELREIVLEVEETVSSIITRRGVDVIK
jgi:hypothetical protein